MAQRKIVKILRQSACKRADKGVTPILPQLHIIDSDFQHIAGLCTFNRYGTCKNMAGQGLFGIAMDIMDFGWRKKSSLRLWMHLRGPRHRINRHSIAAFDGQTRGNGGIEKAPMAGCATGFEMMVHVGVLRANLRAGKSSGWQVFSVVFGIVKDGSRLANF